jgi:hypothetical protein
LSIPDLLLRLRSVLDASGTPYMLTGSYASSLHGQPRATQDIDIVISPTRSQLVELLRHFPDTDYYVSQDAALDALAHRGQFNLIDFATGWKVDFIIMKARDFSREEFSRRRTLDVDEVGLSVASAEDVLIAKLEWAKLAESERQIEDTAGIIRVQGESLDRSYVEKWVAELGLEAQWKDALAKAAV